MEDTAPPADNWIERLVARLNSLARNARFAYLTIILLQLKVMMGLWRYQDLTMGDTASYFRASLRWAQDGEVNIVWSPLYTAFLGTLHLFLDNAFWTLVAARLLIAVLASVLVLAVLRRLLPHPLAWIVAAWWAILPITFDTVYTVHLFAALFPLAIFAVVAYVPGRYGRGIALGLFLATAILVRNEYMLATLLWTGLVFVYEWKQVRTGPPASWPHLARAYGLPVLAALVLIAFFLSRSVVGFSNFSEHAGPKHTLNVCQIYAFNRIQQGDPWQKSPWLECHEIMERDFGVPEPTFGEAFRRNPGAILGHVWWNIQLIPAGTQLGLFNRYGGGANPDYIPAEEAPLVWISLLGLVLLWILGLWWIWQNRRYWWEHQFRPNAFVWLAMGCATVVAFIVMGMQRPRPSYLFVYTFSLMAVTGLSVRVLLRNTFLERTAWLMPIAAILAILLIPSHYSPGYENHHGYQGQDLRQAYNRIRPLMQAVPPTDTTVVVARRFTPQLCMYMRTTACTGLTFNPLMARKPDNVSSLAYLRQQEVDWLYLDPLLLRNPATQALRDTLLAHRWTLVGAGTDTTGTWVIVERPATRPSPAARRRNP